MRAKKFTGEKLELVNRLGQHRQRGAILDLAEEQLRRGRDRQNGAKEEQRPKAKVSDELELARAEVELLKKGRTSDQRHRDQ